MNPLDEKITSTSPASSCARTWSSSSRATPSCPPTCSSTCSASTAPRPTRPASSRASRRSRRSCASTTSTAARPAWCARPSASAGRHKVIDKVSVDLNDKRDVYEATFANLGIKEVLVDADTVKRHPKLLVSGVWCIADLAYEHTEDKQRQPLDPGHDQADPAVALRLRRLSGRPAPVHHRRVDRPADPEHRLQPRVLRPAQQAAAAGAPDPLLRAQLQPDRAGSQGHRQVAHLLRVLAARHPASRAARSACAKLFVNNATGRIGLVGYWDVVAFDEFAGKKKRADKALVDILKNYMANKSFSRGIETLGAEASMAFVGNTQHTAALHAQAQRPVRRPARAVPRLGLPRPPALLHPRLGGGHHPRRDVLRRLRLRGGLPGRDPAQPAQPTTTRSSTATTSSCRPTSPTRDRTGDREDLLRADEDPLPAPGSHRATRSRSCCALPSRAASASRTS